MNWILKIIKRKKNLKFTLTNVLKVSIEAAELKAMPEWLRSGVLDQVDQFGIEMYTNGIADNLEELSNLVNLMRDFFNIGFRLISTSNNFCVEKAVDYQKRYYSLIEVVFYKENMTISI